MRLSFLREVLPTVWHDYSPGAASHSFPKEEAALQVSSRVEINPLKRARTFLL